MKFSGKVGFWENDVELSPGKWGPNIVERPYTGDILRWKQQFQKSDTQNDIFNVNNQISILADLYAHENWPSIRYVVWKGVKWKVTDVEVSYPRLILSIGGVWNGTTKT